MRHWLLSFIKSISISCIFLFIGYALMEESMFAGVLFIALYSTFIVVKAYRKPIPLGHFSALLPGLMAMITYMMLSTVVNVMDTEFVVGAFFLGCIPGVIMGGCHRVYSKDGRIWAKKSFWYLLVWGGSYLITQVAVLSGARLIPEGALALSGFTSASLIALSVLLFFKFKREKLRVELQATLARTGLFVVILLLLVLPVTWFQQDNHVRYGGTPFTDLVTDAQASACPELSQDCRRLMNIGYLNLKTQAEKEKNEACWQLNDEIIKCRKKEKQQVMPPKSAKQTKPPTSSVAHPAPSNSHQIQTRQEPTLPAPSIAERIERAEIAAFDLPQEKVDTMVGASIIQLIVAAIMSALLSSAQATVPDAGPKGTGSPAPNQPKPLYDPNTGEMLSQEDGKYWVWGKWVDEEEARKWIENQVQEQNARRAEIDKRFAEERSSRHARSIAAHQANGDHYDAQTDTWQTADYVAARKEETAAAARKAFDAEMSKKNQDHVANRLRSLLTKEGKDSSVVDTMIASGDWEKLNDMFRDRVWDVLHDSYWEHRDQRRWAAAAQVGKYSAQVVEGAAKAGIAALAGPATLVAGGGTLAAAGAAAFGTGLITGAGEAATAHATITDLEGNVTKEYHGKSGRTIAQAFGAGFLSGAKDGAVGVYCGGPGVSKVAKVFVPASLDVAETYIRTGDGKKALISGGLSVVGDAAGEGVELIENKYLKEVAGTALSGTMGGVGSYAHGGKWGEGVADGLLNRVSSRIGGGIAQNHLEGRQDIAVIPSGPDEQELLVQRALKDVEAENQRVVGYKEMGDRLRLLHDSIHRVEEVDPKTGEKVTSLEVDPKLACDQLGDTGASRTAKHVDPDFQEAIVNTRNKRLIEPADEATISRVKDKPEIQRLMKPGDQLVIKGFSTPGAPVSVGADRDAIMVIVRPGKNGELQAVQQVDRRLWQNEAYEEFYKHTSKYANRDAKGNITAETEPEFMRQKQALDHLKKRPLDEDTIKRFHRQAEERVDKAIKIENQELKTSKQPPVDTATRQARIDEDVERRIKSMQNQMLSEDQIEARAWAASRNQVYTDPYHVEASRDNSNQILVLESGSDGIQRVVRAQIESDPDVAIMPIKDQVGNLRTASGMLEAQRGQRQGLIDDRGYTDMWKIKSEDYVDSNVPEAVAQCKKGIKQTLLYREGQREAGVPVPPLKPHVAEAMELIVRASDDHTASPEQMGQLDQAIKAIRRPDPSGLNPDGIPAYPGGIREAMEKLPEQNLLLRNAMNTPQVYASSVNESELASDAARGAMRGAAGPYMGNEGNSERQVVFDAISDQDEDEAKSQGEDQSPHDLRTGGGS